MDKEVDVLPLERHDRAAAGPAAVPLKWRERARAATGVVVGDQDEQRAVDRVLRLTQCRAAQHDSTVLELDVIGLVTELFVDPELAAIALAESPVEGCAGVLCNLLSDPHELALHTAIAVRPEVDL